MALSSCIKCQNSSFELKEIAPRCSNYKVFLVQCSSCGSPIGVLDYYSAGNLLKQQEEEIKKIKQQLDIQSSMLTSILNTLKILNK